MTTMLPPPGKYTLSRDVKNSLRAAGHRYQPCYLSWKAGSEWSVEPCGHGLPPRLHYTKTRYVLDLDHPDIAALLAALVPLTSEK